MGSGDFETNFLDEDLLAAHYFHGKYNHLQVWDNSGRLLFFELARLMDLLIHMCLKRLLE